MTIFLICKDAPGCTESDNAIKSLPKIISSMKNNNSKIYIAKVDATVELEIRRQIQITKLPTLKYFFNGQQVEFKGRLNNAITTFDMLRFINEYKPSRTRPHNSYNNQYEEDNGVLLLNSNNFEKALKEFNKLVVKFCKYHNFKDNLNLLPLLMFKR